MKLNSIKLKPSKILVQPEANSSSSFSTESHKYERKSIAYIRGSGDNIKPGVIKEGDKIIYDDSHSIDFTIDGVSLSIVNPDDIVAIIQKEA